MAASQPSWRVTGQQETTAIGPNGDFTRGVDVTFQLASGTMGSVFVAESQLTPDRVRELVAEKAERLATIDNLAG